MRHILLVIKHEFRNFMQGDRATLFSYVFLISAWAIVLSSNTKSMQNTTNQMWLVFFAVILSSNFAMTTLVAERLSGSLEIVLSSGIERINFLLGKEIFVFIMSSLIGLACYCCSMLFSYFFYHFAIKTVSDVYENISMALLYLSACFMNISCSSWLSCRIKHPKSLHFINLIVNAIIFFLYMVVKNFFPVTVWILVLMLLVIGFLCQWAAMHDYKTERILHPLEY